jgi:glutathione synthase/RimK-type ligase-like ATP-grasp enzyme
MGYSFSAIQRGHQYSPNHIENDTLILYKTIEELEKMGHKIRVFQEDNLAEDKSGNKLFFNMIRGYDALDTLRRYADNGALIINSVDAIYNCYRINLAVLLPEHNVPAPKTYVVETNPKKFKAEEADSLGEKVWVKRGDVHAIHREDVTLVYSRAERDNILREYHRRGIEKAVVQEHIDGDVVKFYSVRGSEFFHWYYLEKNGQHQFDAKQLKKIAANAADAVNVDIFGGDAIIDKNGGIHIIDLNDWPSYAPIRNEACVHIARLIDEKARKFMEEN